MSSRTLCTSLLMAFLLVAGIGAATFYWRDSTAVIGSGGTIPLRSGPDGEMLSRLESYVRSTGTEQPVSEAAARELLPDVNTMIERLAARLEAAPEDSKGWRMLGWSYFHTARYAQAATAYARAVELDPDSAELKLSYEEAKAKASESDSPPFTRSRMSTRDFLKTRFFRRSIRMSRLVRIGSPARSRAENS